MFLKVQAIAYFKRASVVSAGVTHFVQSGTMYCLNLEGWFGACRQLHLQTGGLRAFEVIPNAGKKTTGPDFTSWLPAVTAMIMLDESGCIILAQESQRGWSSSA